MENSNGWEESQDNIRVLAEAAAERENIHFSFFAGNGKVIIISTNSEIEKVGEEALNGFSGELQMSELINLLTLEEKLKEEIFQLIDVSLFCET